MKIGKVLILIMSIWCLFIGSMYSVMAVDEEEIINDIQGDVLVMDAEMESADTTDEKPNIDIEKISIVKITIVIVVNIPRLNLFTTRGSTCEIPSIYPKSLLDLYIV